jgi:hypothetical protein
MALKGSVIGRDKRLSAFPHTFCPSSPHLLRVDLLGAISDLLLSGALLPLIPPAPFFHKGRRGSLSVLKPETREGMQGLPKKPLL